MSPAREHLYMFSDELAYHYKLGDSDAFATLFSIYSDLVERGEVHARTQQMVKNYLEKLGWVPLGGRPLYYRWSHAVDA